MPGFASHKLRLLLVVCLSAALSCAVAKPPAAGAPVAAQQTAAVVAANPMAVEAGVEILRKGGSAVDAAVAVQAMLGLVEPQSSGIGGGSFMMYYDAGTNRITALDGREKAPVGATPDMFLDESGKPMSYVQAVRTGRSTGVPGALKMLSEAQARLGKLPWRELFTPAIRAATDGFKVPQRLANFLSPNFVFPATPEIRSLFHRPDGQPLQAGDVFRNPLYAQTLQRIAREGVQAFYAGSIAEQIVNKTHEAPYPGTMTLQDLAAYRPDWVEPLCRPYRDYSVCVPPPPSSGVNLLQFLTILDHTDIATRGPRDPQSWFLFAQASRLMYADRDRYVADPQFVPVPVERLLDPAYLSDRASLIGDHLGPPPPPGQFAGVVRAVDATREAQGTSHFVVRDAAGNVVSMTTTVESVFGSGRTVGGFVLNNQLTDFSYRPTDEHGPVANAVQGGKRPRSSMAPVIVVDHEGHFVAAFGSPGGSAILDYNTKTAVGVLAWKLPMQAAIELPNLIARGNDITGETDRFAAGVVDGLREKGITLEPGHAENSGLHGLLRKPDGTLEGGADPRREGIVRMLLVAGERLPYIVPLVPEVVAKNGASHVNVGAGVNELVALDAELLRPEGHDLHQAHRTGGRDCPAVEAALDVHHRHDQSGRQPRLTRAVRLAIHVLENLHALVVFLHDRAQPGLHQRVPHRRVIVVAETLGLGDGLLDDVLQLRIALLAGGGRGQEHGPREEGQAYPLKQPAAPGRMRAHSPAEIPGFRCHADCDIQAVQSPARALPRLRGAECRAARRPRT
jgi:gamma-glutamyltranspeptidase/glutathione hydrolase